MKLKKEKKLKSISSHSLHDLKRYHNEATKFFGSQLMLLKEVVPKIKDNKLAKAAVLLMSCGRTGAAVLQLANQTDTFTSQSAMLARAFMETITNFCYVCISDEAEFRAFILHPIYKHYHNVDLPKMEDDIDFYDLDAIAKKSKARKTKQDKLKKIPIVQEALTIFSETKSNLNWTKKNLNQRIEAIEKWGKLFDVFFTISKIQYYADASEALHGSLYGCTYGIGVFEPGFDYKKKDEINKKLYKESACIMLHLGMLIHESFTLISYSNDIKKIYGYSYKNRGRALNLLLHILEKKTKKLEKTLD